MIESPLTGLQVRGMSKSYPDFSLDLTFDVRPGEFVSLVGPSGCGKSTTLALISGLLKPDSGELLLNGLDLDAVPVWNRSIGMVFQDYALFPHMNVGRNIEYGLKSKGVPRESRLKVVGSLLALVNLPRSASRSITGLSGGEQQRIALARALAPGPDLLLLDEPLSALDALLRRNLRQEIRRIQQKLSVTTLYVTHDQEEALSLSDRIMIMNHGRIEQIGTPQEVYHKPATRFTADFFGRSTMIEVRTVAGEGCCCTALGAPSESGCFFLESSPHTSKTLEGYLFFRPEQAEAIVPEGPPKSSSAFSQGTGEICRETGISSSSIPAGLKKSPDVNHFSPVHVSVCEYIGSGYIIEGIWGNRKERISCMSPHPASPGSAISIAVPAAQCRFVGG